MSDVDQEYLSLVEGMIENLQSLMKIAKTLPTLPITKNWDGIHFEDGGRIPYPFASISKTMRR